MAEAILKITVYYFNAAKKNIIAHREMATK